MLLITELFIIQLIIRLSILIFRLSLKYSINPGVFSFYSTAPF